MKTALEAALFYASQGFFVFPIKAGEKIPYRAFNWKELSTNDPTKIDIYARQYRNCNWALDCGKSGVFVLDIDLRPEKDGLKSLNESGLEPPGFIVQTPSGGLHFYYKGDGPNSSGKLGPGLDTRGKGGYVLIPGSANGNKKPYILRKSESLDPIPFEITCQLNTFNRQDSPLPFEIEEDTDEAVKRGIEYLTDVAPEAIEGQGGDHTTFTVACALRDFGLSSQKALELLKTNWNETKAVPPWDSNELEAKVRNAYKYARDIQGNKSPEVLFPKSTDAIKCAYDIRLSNIKQRDWILGYRYIPGYVTLTVSPGGTGKSLLTILEGLSIASGKQLTHDEVKRKGAVWLYNTEDPLDELERRIAAIRVYNSLPKADFKDFYYSSGYENPIKLAAYDKNTVVVNEKKVQELIKEIKERNILLFILDPFIECHGLSENDNTAIAQVAQLFRRIASETGCAISLIHHTSKGVKDHGNADKARGASSLISTARIAHTLYKMDPKEAKKYGIPEHEASWYIRLDSAKANLSPPQDTCLWFEKKPVKINVTDSDTTGILKPVTLSAVTIEGTEEIITESVIRQVSENLQKEETLWLMADTIEKTGMVNLSRKSIERKIIELFAKPVFRDDIYYQMDKIKSQKNGFGNVKGVRAFSII